PAHQLRSGDDTRRHGDGLCVFAHDVADFHRPPFDSPDASHFLTCTCDTVVGQCRRRLYAAHVPGKAELSFGRAGVKPAPTKRISFSQLGLVSMVAGPLSLRSLSVSEAPG